MKSVFYFLMSVALLVILPANAMGPGSGKGPGGKGMSRPANDKMEKMQGKVASYNKYTVITIDATIQSVGSNELNKQNFGRGTHLYITSDRGQYKIHVAPEFWIKQKKIIFNSGEKITITGSEFKGKGKRVSANNIYAATIIKENGEELNFRDPKTGKGLWKSGMKGEMQKQNMQKKRKQMQETMREKMMKKMQKEMMNQNKEE